MKLNCGPVTSRAQLAMDRDLVLREWHPFFAIWPRRVGEGDCRCLEWIERKGTHWLTGSAWVSSWTWEYRAKESA